MSTKISLLIEDYLKYKHRLGFQLKAETSYLKSFAGFTEESEYDGPLTRSIVFLWCENGDNPSLITKGRRYEAIKPFANYVNSFDPDSEILPKLPYGNPHKRTLPHIYTEEETCRLMKRCDQLYSPDGIRALTMRTAIGLMWSTGLRTSELTNLSVPDVDLSNDTIIVRRTKYNKERIIPIAPDVSGQLSDYRKKVENISTRVKHSSNFFVTTGGKPFTRPLFTYAFQKIRDIIDVSDSGYEHARLYDFRHTFATRTIRSWLENNEDANARLFLLSTYMGHVHPEDTFWYISSIPELMELSSAKYGAIYGGDLHDQE